MIMQMSVKFGKCAYGPSVESKYKTDLFLIKHHSMKTGGGSGGMVVCTIHSTQGGGEWSASPSSAFLPEKEPRSP
jgi:hypothetical protein